MTQVAIIGAGMAGLAAAERLRTLGIACVLFDKSRGYGGRMATRRTGDLQFDHGAQYFTARGADFAAQVATWRDAELVAEWSPEQYVGSPGMTAPARAMAAHHDSIMEAQVTRLVRGDSGWTVHDYRGPLATPHNGSFAAVILAVPAPQAAPLAQSAGAVLPEIEHARYTPCIALMLAFAPEAQRPTRDQMQPEDTAIAWIARNSSKPGRPKNAQTWVVHARADWSRVHLEHNAEDLRAPLLARFRAVTGVHAEPTHVSAHRWRFALVEQEAGAACFFDPDAMVGACGDWCLGPRVESAYDSGCAMAETVFRALR